MGRRKTQRTEVPSGTASLDSLQSGLTGERRLIGAVYMNNPALLSLYREYYWPVSFEQTRYILSLLKERYPRRFGKLSLTKLIDIGSGPAPVAAACIAGAGSVDITLVDHSSSALDSARSLCKKHEDPANPIQIQTVCKDFTNLESFSSEIDGWGRADCISFGHSLNESWSDRPDLVSRRVALLEYAARGLARDGIILVIEPALLSTSRDVLAVRNLLVDKGWRVLAPCCGRSTMPCPAFSAGPIQTCHEEVPWTVPPRVAALAREAGISKDTLKMTWFVFQPPCDPDSVSSFDNRTAFANSDDLLFRVVSDPLLNKAGRIRKLICGKAGRFPLSNLPGNAVFDSLVRGQIVTIQNPEIRENGWGLDSRTVITVRRVIEEK